MTAFFFPWAKDGDEEKAWQACLVDAGASAKDNARRIYSIEYEHEDSRYVVTVGERRMQYRRKTGPRGGHLKNADYLTHGSAVGAHVVAIIRTPQVVLVFSAVSGGWANPSYVGPGSITRTEYFANLAGEVS